MYLINAIQLLKSFGRLNLNQDFIANQVLLKKLFVLLGKEWRSGLINSAQFERSGAHKNPRFVGQ